MWKNRWATEKKKRKKKACSEKEQCVQGPRVHLESGLCEWQVAQRGHIVLFHSFRQERLEMTVASAFHFMSREEEREKKNVHPSFSS